MVLGSISFDTSSTNVSSQKDILESAARLVDYHLNIDNNFTGFIQSLKCDLPTISGLNDHDYPGVSELGLNLHNLSQLSLVKRTPIPSELFEQFRLIQGSCVMGLFPEIGRAWLLIDTNIFIWSFQDGSDLAYYDGIKETIICVGLAKPKPGVFQDFIHYILCLATPVEIVLLGVSFNRQREDASLFEEMHLLPEPLFSFPTDNTFMSTFASTAKGRIFLGGQDGCIYEFTYQAGESWFSKKCKKTNHSSNPLSFIVPSFIQNVLTETDGIAQLAVDDSRNILYARTNKGSIQVFDLGSDGNQMHKAANLHYSTINHLAATVAKTIDKKNFSLVVHISPVETNESRDVHLIAVFESGVRIYFSTFYDSGQSRPCTLKILHLRLPPGFSANSAMDRPERIHTSYYKKGLSLLIANMSENYDTVFTTSDDLFVFHNILIETHTTLPLDSRLWAMAEIPSKHQFKLKIGDSLEQQIDPPLLLTQHIELPRQFLFLSNQGCSIFTKPRPVDLLAKLLIENGGPMCDAVKAFFRLHREAQACAMCLILCCSLSAQDKQVAQFASQAFFHYGGIPSFTPHQAMDQIMNPGDPSLPHTQQVVPQRPTVWASTPTQGDQSYSPSFPQPSFSTVCSPVKSVFTVPQQNVLTPSAVGQFNSPQSPVFSPNTSFASVAQSPIQQVQPSPLGITNMPRMTNSEIAYSAKHDGLHFYFARIMRPLWNLKLVTEQLTTYDNITTRFLTSNVKSEDLVCFLSHLGSLKNFISHNLPRFVNSSHISSIPVYPARQMNLQSRHLPQDVSSIHMSSAQKKAQNEADLQERNSISNLHQLVTYTNELLGLWKVLCDHQFENVITFLAPECQEQLKQMMFKDFVMDVHDIAGNLASAVINFYLDDNASTIAISQKLREVCPSVYRIEDATISKVFEIVKHTKSILNKIEQAKELREALKLCKEVCPNFDLLAISNLFQEVKFYEGILDICLCTAQRLDPQNLALHFYINGESENDQQGLQAYTNRMNCYKTIISVLNTLVGMRVPSNQCPPVPVIPGGQDTTRTPTLLTPDEAKAESEEMFEMALKTDDELFHSALYDWLFENGHTDALLSISSHFLENYLRRRTHMNSDSVQSFDLLWKFHEKNKNFVAAARVLSLLADKHDPNLLLPHRLEYLSRAIICLKSAEVRAAAGGGGEFLHELEEKMEVVRIQLHILETLQQKNIPGIQESLAKLNANFMDITQLFEEFAVRYDLPESKLAIVHCAGHYDSNLIEGFWQGIIDKELEATCANPTKIRENSLKQKILSLSQLYLSSEKYFPVRFIIKHLEIKTCALNFEPGWVYQIMLSIGINIADIWSVYHQLYRSKDTCWLTLKKPLHLLEVLCRMINEFTTVPSLLPPVERRMFVTLCQDAVAGYLVDLQAMNPNEDNVAELMKGFKSIQPKLDRLTL